MNYFTSVLFAAVAAFFIFMLFRNEWVSKNRLKILYEDAEVADRMIDQGRFDEIKDNFHPRFKSMPSYHRMMWMLWIWDVKKFIKHK